MKPETITAVSSPPRPSQFKPYTFCWNKPKNKKIAKETNTPLGMRMVSALRADDGCLLVLDVIACYTHITPSRCAAFQGGASLR